ncbi:MAG: 1-acyl-sn-glycerol-3-phosphate acyltransferase [Verrucomicrobia bacterium]|nr:1-acyl-sn-glycerol-3-phosphate acyltransferase [Verrucomicrobiota bacterium]
MKAVYYAPWILCRAVFGTYFHWRVYEADRVPETGPVILAANHASLLDPPLVGAALKRDICYLARENLFRNPLFGAVLRSWNVVPVDRDGGGATGLRAIMDRLNAGNAVILFPEGTRTLDGALQPARSGIGLLAIKSAAPVVPIRLFGTFEAYGRKMRLPRPRSVAVKFGRPMDLDRWRAEAQTCSKARLKEIYQRTAEAIMDHIARLEPCADKTTFP